MRCVNLDYIVNNLIRAANKGFPIEWTYTIITIAHVPLESLCLNTLNLLSDWKEATRFLRDDRLARLNYATTCLQHDHKTVFVHECEESIALYILMTVLAKHMNIWECLIHATSKCTHGKHCEFRVTHLLLLFINENHCLLKISVILRWYLLNDCTMFFVEVTDIIPNRIKIADHNLRDV